MDPESLNPNCLETTDTDRGPYSDQSAPPKKATDSKPRFGQGLEPPPSPPSASSATSSATSSSSSSSSGSSASYQLPIVGSKRKGSTQSSGKEKNKNRKRSCPSCNYVTTNGAGIANHKKAHSGQFQSCNYCSFKSDIKWHFARQNKNKHRCKEGSKSTGNLKQKERCC